MNQQDYAYWLNLTRATTRNYTAEQQDRIATLCTEAALRGELPAVWHMAAEVGGHRCNCARCRA